MSKKKSTDTTTIPAEIASQLLKGELDPAMSTEELIRHVRRVMAQQGGTARAKKLSAKRRTEIATLAGKASGKARKRKSTNSPEKGAEAAT